MNTSSRREAVAACVKEMRTTTAAGDVKCGTSLEKAMRIRAAKKQSNLSFEQVYDRVKQVHAPLSDFIGRDTEVGLAFMRRESRIALNVLYDFASRGIPCLGIHDSFVAPAQYGDQLHSAIDGYYRAEMGGFSPVINARESFDAPTFAAFAA